MGQVCSDLSDSIENAMHALYNLETATINVIGKSRQYESNLYQTIRQSNKVGWDQIVQHLEHSGQCGREIETLGANFFNAPTPDLLEHAKEIATDSRSLLSESQKILEGHILYLIDFRKPEKHLRTLLEKSHRTRITRPDYNSSYIQTSGR